MSDYYEAPSYRATPQQDNPVVVSGPTVTNMLADPSSEFWPAPEGWFDANNSDGTLGTSTSTGVVGGGRATMFTSGGVASEILQAQDVVVTEGVEYTASAYLTSSTVRSARLKINWREADNTLISTSLGSASALSGTPTRYSLTATAPALAVRCELIMETVTGYNPSELFYLDNGMFTEGATLYPYFDGDTTNDGTYIYAWTSTPYASMSTRTPV